MKAVEKALRVRVKQEEVSRRALQSRIDIERCALLKQRSVAETLAKAFLIPLDQNKAFVQAFEGIRTMAERLESYQKQTAAIARTLENALLPTARMIVSFNAELARAVEPFQAAFASVSAWEASLTTRMEALIKPWALPDRLDQSMTGFAHLSRLSDAVHTAEPYSEPVGELVTDELGVGVEADPNDETPIERDKNAIKVGLNPQLIAFPTAAYSEVVFAAGFKFHFPLMPVLQAVESTDAGTIFDPMHGRVLTELEQRLRQIVEERLRGLVGPNWIKRRVSEEMRKRWLERQGQDRDDGRPVFSPIQYADFMDLPNIITRSDNWREAFELIFQNRDDFLLSLRRLHPVRKAIAHSRPLRKSDVLTLVSEATRIFSALKIQVLS